jgi:hypothetical protein
MWEAKGLEADWLAVGMRLFYAGGKVPPAHLESSHLEKNDQGVLNTPKCKPLTPTTPNTLTHLNTNSLDADLLQ